MPASERTPPTAKRTSSVSERAPEAGPSTHRAAERMSRVDYAWLRMDNDANQMMIVGVWLLKPTLTVAELRQRVAQTLLTYPRFCQRVSEDAVGAAWVTVPVDLDQHVVKQTLRVQPGQTSLDALKDCVADLATWALPRKRPLWQMHVVEDLGDGRSAMITRIHHCIGDGISLISVMLAMADADPSQAAAADAPSSRRRSKGAFKGLFKGPGGQDWFTAVPLQAARQAGQIVNDIAAFASMDDDSPTRLKGRATPGKSVAWCEPLPLDGVKLVGRVMGVTVNDVLLACVAGAIGNYLRSKGDDIQGQAIRAMVPVNLRPLDQAHKLGNKFGLVPLMLPIGVDHPTRRLYDVHARMQALKGSYQPLLAFGVLAMTGTMFKPLQDRVLNLYAKKATAVMTNVPGPKDPIRFCGRAVDQVMFWVPQSGDIGLGVSILSYAGGVQLGLITDTGMCADPQAIVDGFAPEFDKLLLLALMAPWES
jgi:diacylglycerol O-acyltransferase / wax synthase